MSSEEKEINIDYLKLPIVLLLTTDIPKEDKRNIKKYFEKIL